MHLLPCPAGPEHRHSKWKQCLLPSHTVQLQPKTLDHTGCSATANRRKYQWKKDLFTSASMSFPHSFRITNTHFHIIDVFGAVVTCSGLSKMALRKSTDCVGGMHLQTAWREVRNGRHCITALLHQFRKAT